MGAASEHVESLADLELAVGRAKAADRSYLISLRTDPDDSSGGGFWWDVAVPEVSERADVRTAREEYVAAKSRQPY